MIFFLWPRPQWEVLEAVIGQLDEPFQVTVQYSSCTSHEVGFLAFDSLELKDCDMMGNSSLITVFSNIIQLKRVLELLHVLLHVGRL